MFGNVYYGKTVLITGNTGFKGSWLTVWLLKLGAKVVGVSIDIPTSPSMFEVLNLRNKIIYYQEDIRNFEKLKEIFELHKPDFIFHLAAQPIVSVSYKDPLGTIYSNVMGTANVLEVLRVLNQKCIAVIITSDKAYDNIEQVWGYKENDSMGGKDIYSGSKGAAELVIKSYFYSFFNKDNSNVKIGVGRAGNVIGGGDWAKDRIVVDCMLSWSQKRPVEIRSPRSTRPWQHVLEPLSGYLNLGMVLHNNPSFNGECFNFGPRGEQNRSVEELLLDLSQIWNFKNENEAFDIVQNSDFNEAGLLKLNCDKALFYLKWQANLDYDQMIEFTSGWYRDFYKADVDMLDKTLDQILLYENLAKSKGILWTE
ncbi:MULTISPECIES: CDP-glucose 4,6-dehydratase [unclassified Campylobacter]|uniref:CDP-glucose 4,6-dehydratase n=1 Tax=unclassified Campylobacter TaxID=2593542 RepID=UPI003D355735